MTKYEIAPVIHLQVPKRPELATFKQVLHHSKVIHKEGYFDLYVEIIYVNEGVPARLSHTQG